MQHTDPAIQHIMEWLKCYQYDKRTLKEFLKGRVTNTDRR